MKPPVLLLLILLLMGCSSPVYLSPEELNKYILDPDNGLIQKSEINGYSIQVYNKPTDLWVEQDIIGEHPNAADIKALRSKYNHYYYFIVDLSRDNKEALQVNGNMGRFSELVQTLSFRMGSYANMTTAKQDTIPLGDFILNRTFGLSSATSLLFVFNKEKAANVEWVQFNLNEFGLGVGNQRFRFKTKDLEEAPEINFAVNSK